MPYLPTESQNLRRKKLVIREVIEVLMEELATLSNRQWEALPELKKKKVILASQLREINRNSNPADPMPSDLMMLKTLITELENQSRQKIAAQIDFIGKQMLALQEQNLYWLECLNVSFAKTYEPLPTP